MSLHHLTRRRVAAAVALFIPAAAPALAQGRPIALEDYYRVESVASPAISPDGRWVAYTRTYVVESENRRHSEIWLAPADGSAPPSRITHPSFSSSDPRWSPDGRLLAFSSRRRAGGASGSESGTWFLRIGAPGGEAFQIPGVTETPIFSPDGRWIAFTKPTPPPARERPALGESERRIEERFRGRAYEWMNARFDGRGYLPDPRDPAATPPRELYVVARDGGTPRRITTLGVDVQNPAWSPDARSIAFVANQHQRDEHQYDRADVWVVSVDGGAPRRLTDDGYDHDSPAWSPDGRSIAVRRQMGLSMVIAAKQDHGAAIDVVRLPAAGGPMQNLTADWELLPGQPRWSPDGRFVYFDGGTGGETHLFRARGTGGAVEQVTRGARRLGGFSMSADFAHMAYTSSDATRPAEAYVARVDGSGERKLSAVNDALLRELALSPARRVTFNSKDGTPIEGWVILPPGYDSARGPYPLVLNIHGGPHGAYGVEFSFPFQLQAANGYVVLYTNPRGSTGYGEKFLWATWAGWGGKDYEDVMAGVDHVLSGYAVDPKRLGVTGYSYGGFLTDWIITQTSRFGAAIAGAGISNWISDFGTADIPRTKESEFFGAPWEPRGRALMEKWSPIYHAGNVSTPTMFIHGEADLRVPIEQAEQMYTALTKRKVPARFVRYPDMYHGGWTPWNTVHRYHEELTWWDRWIGAKRPVGTQKVGTQ